MNGDDASGTFRPGADSVQSGADDEELPVKIHDYTIACRRELERLEAGHHEAGERYRAVREEPDREN